MVGGDLGEYYFRIRESGASVFRVDTENRHSRIELEEIATINLRKGVIRPHGETKLTAADRAAIQTWIEGRQDLLATREVDDLLRCVDHLNLAAQWVQTRATDAQVEAVMNPLLLAMHDLRAILVRRRAEDLLRQDRQMQQDEEGG